ncbi:uncharacterized protein LTR77_000512 [Saxophila tyrrhenica]|uniref:P-loop containing nucleoside triphosphate hydrolase protein n=1 Tax=Saxophila tyrrhenica TaxID=1690608 RepID=A0AAV9PSR5_9PEZI|nr:hypothetical protein LTR77_000512 [Saxophila tyrrhenica]
MAPQILVFGLPRTGTQSLLDALEILGCSKTYHMRNVQERGHIDDWITLLKQRNEGEGVNLSLLDHLLDDCEAVADFPVSIFYRELLRLYPNAKVVVTSRNEDEWIRSMSTTLIDSHTKPDADTTRPMRPLAEAYHTYCWNNDFTQFGREYYRTYLRDVRVLARGRTVLEYHPGDGWASLCEFVKCDIPEESFPRKDEMAQYKSVEKELVK